MYRRGPGGKRYCSLACAGLGHRSGGEVSCESCGKNFYVEAHRLSHARFCSVACHDVWQGRAKTRHVCKVCDEEFRLSPCFVTYRTPMYCSADCRNADPEHKARLLAMNTLQQAERITRAEAAGYALLDLLEVDYRPQQIFKDKFTPDATVEVARLVVQFDGDYWHDRKGTSMEARIRRRVALDRSQDAYIRACGWRVLRLWESDLHGDPEGCTERIAAALADEHHETSSMS
jgi:very-short-patch-repair endonuclease